MLPTQRDELLKFVKGLADIWNVIGFRRCPSEPIAETTGRFRYDRFDSLQQLAPATGNGRTGRLDTGSAASAAVARRRVSGSRIVTCR